MLRRIFGVQVRGWAEQLACIVDNLKKETSWENKT
jgi:hypothetical protein